MRIKVEIGLGVSAFFLLARERNRDIEVLGMGRELSIYVHIPFCAQKCLYCDFLSGKGSRDETREYVECLCKEIRSHTGKYREYQIRSIFFGGGTPSILKDIYIEEIMNAIREGFDLTDSRLAEIEVTMEANPGTLTMEKLKGYRNSGVNRLSMGLQSAHNDELRRLGRIHTYEQFLESYDMARKAGFTNINVDLMSGLPGQNWEMFEDTLKKVIELNPEHISAYSLIVEEGTPFYELYGTEEGEKQLPSEEEDRRIYHLTKKMLLEAGYERYEISNYAKPGKESRHNLSYWIGIDYLGLGLGASSLLEHKRYRNIEDKEQYQKKIKNNETVAQLEEELTKQDEMSEFMFLGLRVCKGISTLEFETKFGTDIFSIYGDSITRLIANELLEQDGEFLRLTEHGVDVSNQVFLEFVQ